MTDASLMHEAQLVDSRYRDLLDSMPDGIVVVDSTGHIVYANGHAESLFGYPPAGLQGRLVESLMPQRFRDAHVGHRACYFGHPRARAMGAGIELYGLQQRRARSSRWRSA